MLEKKKKVLKDKNITDKTLIEYLKHKQGKIRFIGEGPGKSKEKIKRLEERTDLLVQWELVRELWGSLLGDALVFLKSQDKRERHHDKLVYGVRDLSSFFKTFREYETVLYGARGRYRDHLVHVFRVYLLGEYVIRKTFGFDKVNCEEVGKVTISQEEKEAMWCIISLCHDLGYPLEAISDINQKARDMFQKFGRVHIEELAYGLSPQYQTISDFILRFISSSLQRSNDGELYDVHLQTKFFLKFSNALDRYNHGLISCIVLMKNLVYFLEADYLMDSVKPLTPDDARHFLIRRVILRAIASHACDEIYHLQVTTFPFLLLILDEMQDWGRPRLVEVFKKQIPESHLTINEMSATQIAYTIRFTGTPRNQRSHGEMESFFKSKCKRFAEVLRSAVGGEYQRNIELVFNVVDEIDTERKRSFVLRHYRPDEVKISIDGKEVNFYEYLFGDIAPEI